MEGRKRVIRFNAAQFGWLLGKSTHRAAEIMDQLAAGGADVIQPGRTKAIDAEDAYKYIETIRINPKIKNRSQMSEFRNQKIRNQKVRYTGDNYES